MAANILKVKKNSVAARAGIRAGDVIEDINDIKPRDIIDYQISCLDDELRIGLRREGARRAVSVGPSVGEPLGITFSSSIFDRVRTCQNRCLFCFIDQLPRDLRRPLYLKDDDFRLSFLYGNFITLTNLGEDDIVRILSQRLSPLYVSLHSIDSDVRKALIRPRNNDRTVDYLKKLISGGIETHIQIVFCPGINDGDDLRNTLKWLADAGVASVGIVPVGLTGHREGLEKLDAVDEETARNTIELISGIQKRNLKTFGRRIVFLADEFYLTAGAPLPPYDHYEDFFQLENGIGIARRFIDESLREISKTAARKSKRKFTLLTSEIAFGPVSRAADALIKLWGLDLMVSAVKNRFLGGGVSVSGLLSGGDLIGAFEDVEGDSTVLVPDICLNGDGLFLDGLGKDELRETAPFELEFVPSGGAAFIKRLGGMIS